MKTRVTITETIAGEYQKFQTGYVDGYIYSEHFGPMAVVVIDQTRKIWCVPLNHLYPAPSDRYPAQQP